MPYNSYDIHMKDPNSKKPLLRRCMPYRGWGYPDVCRIRGSVLPSCVPILFFSALFSAFVATLYLVFEINLTIPESLVGTVAVVVGLLLAFRTNNAYDRYYEGRKLFTSMCTNIRNATRNIWVGVKEHNDADRREKVKNIKLLLAYAVATKRHLRLEFGTDWLDLKSLVPEGFQLTYFDGNVTQENTVLGSGHDEDPNRDRSDNANRPSSDTPSVQHSLNSIANRISPTTYNNLRKSMSGDETTIWFGASEWGRDVDASMSLPLEIIYHIGLYIDKVHETKAMDADRFGAVSANLNSLVEIIGDLERISDTPIPFAYNIHLKQATLLYVWALPFTIVDKLGWYTIIIVVGVAFVLFGVEAIGAEIENPFGYDRNDLPLDGYCDDLKAEIEYVQRHIPSGKAVPASQSSR